MKINEKDGGILVTIKVIPKSSRNSIIISEDILKIKLTSPPVDGKANKALIDFLSKKINVKKKDIIIKIGETSRNKTLWINILKNDFINKIGGK